MVSVSDMVVAKFATFEFHVFKWGCAISKKSLKRLLWELEQKGGLWRQKLGVKISLTVEIMQIDGSASVRFNLLIDY